MPSAPGAPTPIPCKDPPLPATPKSPSQSPGTDALLYALIGAGSALAVFGSLAWTGGNTANSLTGSGPWHAPFEPVTAALHPGQLYPHLSSMALLIATRVVPGIAALALAATGLWLWSRHRSKPSGLATSRDLAPLLPAEITAKARDLRPSLADCKRPGNPPR
ncbi:hypothetical protein ABH931_005800 [Streptacidiphilus sp. MAP12-33]